MEDKLTQIVKFRDSINEKIDDCIVLLKNDKTNSESMDIIDKIMSHYRILIYKKSIISSASGSDSNSNSDHNNKFDSIVLGISQFHDEGDFSFSSNEFASSDADVDPDDPDNLHDPIFTRDYSSEEDSVPFQFKPAIDSEFHFTDVYTNYGDPDIK